MHLFWGQIRQIRAKKQKEKRLRASYSNSQNVTQFELREHLTPYNIYHP